MGLLLVGTERRIALPLLVDHPAVGTLQALMQPVAKAPGLLPAGVDERRQGGSALGGEFRLGLKLGNHNQGGWHLNLLAKTTVSMPPADWGKQGSSRKTLLRGEQQWDAVRNKETG